MDGDITTLPRRALEARLAKIERENEKLKERLSEVEDEHRNYLRLAVDAVNRRWEQKLIRAGYKLGGGLYKE